jgi:tetratricopeptide (TPR) repeat protein
VFAVPVRVQPIVFVSFLLLLGCGSPGPQSPTATTRPAGGADRQIRWQRTLEDALAISAAEGRPILIAVNADGESASERIVRERYRDPEFVALTRPFVCLIASPHRHSPRDYEWDGSRMPCPRFGEVTCGEHQAVEPVVFDRFLGGERISPRHALVLPSGEKAFDLSLQWDLHEIDRSLADAAAEAPPAGSADPPPFPWRELSKNPSEREAQWLSLARGRTHRERSRFEDVVSREGDLGGPLAALEKAGGTGSIGILRVLLAKHARRLGDHLDRITDLVTALGLRAQVAAALWDLVNDPGVGLGGWSLPSGDLLRLLARVDGASPRTRSFLLSHAVTDLHRNRSPSEPALRELLGEKESHRALTALRDEGGSVSPSLAALARHIEGRESPLSRPSFPESDRDLEGALADAEAALRGNPNDPSLLAAVGRASLGLARRRIEANRPADLLLADAERFLSRSSEAMRRDVSLLLDRARVAYHLGKFDEEERLALEALSLLPPLPEDPIRALQTALGGTPSVHSILDPSLERWRKNLDELRSTLSRPPERIEAYRWIGDAAARLLAARSGGDPAVEVGGMARGLRALFCAALGVGSDATDWVSLASWFGALGRRSEETFLAQQGLYRHPESTELHQVLETALVDAGRVFEIVPHRRMAKVQGSPTSEWYLGRAAFTAAEWHRRGEASDRAIESYREAEGAFRASAEMRPDFTDSVNHYIAMAALGRGFAHLIADRRKEAADCLVEGLTIRPAIDGVRDGLDREAVDLLDGALEWRESGPSPVDPLERADRLAKAAPADARWIRRVADSELREALRADGRGAPGEGDAYLTRSIEVARRSLEIDGGEESRRTLAQSATVMAERLLHRGEAEAARPFLAEAAPLEREEAPAADAPTETLAALAAKLREKLGPARPSFRPGR